MSLIYEYIMTCQLNKGPQVVYFSVDYSMKLSTAADTDITSMLDYVST